MLPACLRIHQALLPLLLLLFAPSVPTRAASAFFHLPSQPFIPHAIVAECDALLFEFYARIRV